MLTEVDREWRGPFEAVGPMPTGFAPTATASRGAALVVIVLGGSRRGEISVGGAICVRISWTEFEDLERTVHRWEGQRTAVVYIPRKDKESAVT